MVAPVCDESGPRRMLRRQGPNRGSHRGERQPVTGRPLPAPWPLGSHEEDDEGVAPAYELVDEHLPERWDPEKLIVPRALR